MTLGRYGTFTGGIDLPDEKRNTLDEPIRPAPPVEKLLVPLAWGGVSAEPIIAPPRRVAAGAMIASADDLCIYAPLDGKVTSITDAAVAGRDGFAVVGAIEISELSAPGHIPPLAPVFDWRAADNDTLLARILAGGIPMHRRGGQTVEAFITSARRAECTTLVANVMEGQPYVTADHCLLVEYGTDVIRGLAMLARAIGAGEIFLAVDQRRTEEYRQLVDPARMYNISRIALPHKYPIGAEAILTKVLTQQEVPAGGTPMDCGVAVIDVATAFAVYRWVACEAAPTARVVTVSGERAGRCGNFWVPFGTPCAPLSGAEEDPILHGGPITGLQCPPGAVVSPATDAVLAIDTAPPAAPTPCIRCGWCTDHCSARLNVALLNDAYEHGDIGKAARLYAIACVECGVCSYVCPSRLPLSQRVRQLKRLLRGKDARRDIPSTMNTT